MRLFGSLFNFDREGRGVSKHEPKKPAFLRFWAILFRHFFDICKVSMLLVLFSIPVITIGPATAAATYVLRNIAREEHTFIWMDFYDNFKRNFKMAFVSGIFDLIAAALFVFNIFFYMGAIVQPGVPKYFYLMLGAAVAIFVCYFIAKMYLYPIIVTFDISLKNAYKNSFIFTLTKLLPNLLYFILKMLAPALIFVLPLLLLKDYLIVYTSIFYFVFFAGFTQFVSVFCVWPNIQKIMIDRFKEDKPEDDEEPEEDF